eukprot:3487663-Alexandrium_andersonii.AAC.1
MRRPWHLLPRPLSSTGAAWPRRSAALSAAAWQCAPEALGLRAAARARRRTAWRNSAAPAAFLSRTCSVATASPTS